MDVNQNPPLTLEISLIIWWLFKKRRKCVYKSGTEIEAKFNHIFFLPTVLSGPTVIYWDAKKLLTAVQIVSDVLIRGLCDLKMRISRSSFIVVELSWQVRVITLSNSMITFQKRCYSLGGKSIFLILGGKTEGHRSDFRSHCSFTSTYQ